MEEAGMDARQGRWQKWYLMVRRHRKRLGEGRRGQQGM